MSQIIENVRCVKCNQKVFATVTLEDKSQGNRLLRELHVSGTNLKPDVSKTCTNGGTHRVSILDLI